MAWPDLLKKTKQALTRSREALGRIGQLLERPQFGEELWGELEEALLLADVGVPTTELLLERLQARTKAPGPEGGQAGHPGRRRYLSGCSYRPAPSVGGEGRGPGHCPPAGGRPGGSS